MLWSAMCAATQDSFSLTIVLLLGLSLTANAQSSRGSDNGSPLPFPRAANGIPSETTDGDDDARLAKTLIPHPYLLVGPWLIGAGYARLAWRLEAGLDVESDYVVITAAAAYDNGHQVNDGVQPNPKGHDRYVSGAIYLRVPRLFSGQSPVGLGGSWSELSTTKYTKGADRPPFGIGYDYVHSRCPGCQHDFSTRILMNWVFTGSDWRDGVHGPEISLSMPSPSENGHWSFQERFCVYRFHLTVTDPSNIPLMRSQPPLGSSLRSWA